MTGEGGKRPYVEHGQDIKAQALADILAGASVHGVAKRLGVSPATIRRWRGQAELGATAPSQVPYGQGANPQNVLDEPDFRGLTLHFLQESLSAGERILRQTADPAWLAQQRAGELAVFYGVVFDKAARILGALADERPGGGGDQMDTGTPGLPAPS
jgi:Homeodomain-like domain